MNWLRATAGVLILWSTPAWSATLNWSPNNDPDLAGYRVYRCSQQPCSLASGKATVMAVLGTVAQLDIGAPAVTQYYFITAYDVANNESTESNLSTFTPAGTPPPVTPPPGTPPPVAPPPVAPPAIGASPLSLSFGATQGGANPATQTVSISNTGGARSAGASAKMPPG